MRPECIRGEPAGGIIGGLIRWAIPKRGHPLHVCHVKRGDLRSPARWRWPALEILIQSV